MLVNWNIVVGINSVCLLRDWDLLFIVNISSIIVVINEVQGKHLGVILRCINGGRNPFVSEGRHWFCNQWLNSIVINYLSYGKSSFNILR